MRDPDVMDDWAAVAWWVAWCAGMEVDPGEPTVAALTDAALDARLEGWVDADLVELVEAVGEFGGLWRTSEWATLRLGL